mgnify:CR=1 FL=1
MRTILKSILLMSLCSSATAPAMAIKRANHDKKEANIHEEEASDSTRHQPLTESSVKLNEVVVTGLTGSQKLKQSPAPQLRKRESRKGSSGQLFTAQRKYPS